MSNNVRLFTLLLSLCRSKCEVIDLIQAIALDKDFNTSDFTLCYTKAISRLNTL